MLADTDNTHLGTQSRAVIAAFLYFFKWFFCHLSFQWKTATDRGRATERDTQREAGAPLKRKEASEARTASQSPFSVEVSVDGCEGSPKRRGRGATRLSASVFGLNCYLKRRRNSGTIEVNICVCIFLYVRTGRGWVGSFFSVTLLVCETTEAKEMAGSAGVSGIEK